MASMAHVFLKTNMKILYNSEKMKSIFDEPPIVLYKRDKDILVHRKHNFHCDHDIPYISILHENQHFSLIINNERPCQCNNQNIVNNKQSKDNIQKEVYSNFDFIDFS
jgi:hypothetical protein